MGDLAFTSGTSFIISSNLDNLLSLLKVNLIVEATSFNHGREQTISSHCVNMSSKTYEHSGNTTEWEDILIKKGITTREDVLLSKGLNPDDVRS